ncbi:MAG: hypothetical protein JWN51_2412 [Phycisphaerales bacterium]|nr:hypothetical protein [Phycisphaerales bacterium]
MRNPTGVLAAGVMVAWCVAAAIPSQAAPTTRPAGPATRPAGPVADAAAAARAQKVVAKLLAQLEDPEPSMRERARLALSNAGPEADEQVAAALKAELLEPATRRVLEPLAKVIHSRAVRFRRLQEALAWARRAPQQFDALSKKDPKWGAAASEALWSVYGPPASRNNPAAVMESFKKAVDLGCNDPLFLYLDSLIVTRSDPEAAKDMARKAAKRLWEVDYSPDIKMEIAHHYPGFADGNDAVIRAIDGEMDAWFAAAVKDPKIPSGVSERLITIMYDVCGKRLQDKAKAADAVTEMYAKARPGAPDPLIARGRFYVDYAWEARGGGWANTVTQDGWKQFAIRLKIAQQALEKAYDMDPTDERAAVKMLTVNLGQGGGREEMEKWYKRAMEANPDCMEACTAKSYYLEPKWHGSARDMLIFGHQLLAGQNWYAGLPLLLLKQHETLAALTNDPQGYWQQEFVWQDVRAVCEGALGFRPNEPHMCTLYAKLACQCGKWDVAAKQFDALGDKVDMSQFKSKEMYDALVKQAHEGAGK